MEVSTRTLSKVDLYLFDTQGYLLRPGVFSRDEVAGFWSALGEREPSLWQDFSNAHRWNRIARSHDVFARLSADERLVDLAFDVINQPMRLLDSYALRYAPGGSIFMHSGNVQDTTYPDGTRATLHMGFQNHYHDGRIYTMQVKTLVYLTDITEEAEGAFCYIEGSHKANFPFRWEDVRGQGPLAQSAFPGVRKVLPKAGDVVVLNETLLHGASRTNKSRGLLSFLYGPAFLPDFERIQPVPGDLRTVGYYDADYEPSAIGFVAGGEKDTGRNG